MSQTIQRDKLFLASRIALIFTAMTFAFRASLEGVWGPTFNLTKEQLGWIFGPAFWGFTLAMIFGGPLCDVLGMKRLLVLLSSAILQVSSFILLQKMPPCCLSAQFVSASATEWLKLHATRSRLHYILITKQPC